MSDECEELRRVIGARQADVAAWGGMNQYTYRYCIRVDGPHKPETAKELASVHSKLKRIVKIIRG